MATPPRWQKTGNVSSFTSSGQGLQPLHLPLHQWLPAQGGAASPAPQASQSGPSGSATAVGPSGDALPVHSGAVLNCDRGQTPGRLLVVPSNRPANINDARSGVNITPCGMCRSMSNPAVVAATAAALGVLTPAPCTPITLRWDGGSSTQQSGGAAALHPGSTLRCSLGGTLRIFAAS